MFWALLLEVSELNMEERRWDALVRWSDNWRRFSFITTIASWTKRGALKCLRYAVHASHWKWEKMHYRSQNYLPPTQECWKLELLIEHVMVYWTLAGSFNIEYALDIERFIEHWMVYWTLNIYIEHWRVHWILNQALNVENVLNIDWIIELN